MVVSVDVLTQEPVADRGPLRWSVGASERRRVVDVDVLATGVMT
jgi:hypothetical protein